MFFCFHVFMRIGIDARMLGPEQGGLGRYAEQLIKHLLEIDKKNQYVLFVRRFPPPRHPDSVGIGAPPSQGGDRVRYVLADITWYGWREQIKMPMLIKKEKVDMMHFPHWNVPLLYNDPFVVTIHDLIMWHYPRQEASTLGPAAYYLKDKASRLVVKHAAAKAKRIMVTSEFTKHDVHKTLGVPLEKMTVTYQAPIEIQKSKVKSQKSLVEYGITKPYALYVGSAYPHKNLERLLEAWKLIEERYADKYQLVLAGKDSYFYQRLKNNITMKQYNNVLCIGYVPDHELELLYKGARLYVFPSLFEGFGLPPLEAMANGLPVVSSNAACLPEALGEAAMYFDPLNIAQMADVIEQGLTDESSRYELRERAKEELRRYSWEKMARETLDVYSPTPEYRPASCGTG